MLTKRIIPCLDVNHGRVVKGRQFKNLRDVDDPVALGKAYSDAGADELVFYDITATHENRPVFTETVKAIAREISMSFVPNSFPKPPNASAASASSFPSMEKETIKAAGTSTSKAEERTQASTSSNGQKKAKPWAPEKSALTPWTPTERRTAMTLTS